MDELERAIFEAAFFWHLAQIPDDETTHADTVAADRFACRVADSYTRRRDECAQPRPSQNASEYWGRRMSK